ncbi:MAG: histidine ammonia-lyase [Deltaproteobacteria bacterium CG07_land_8_20_14_0_80_38_7]|nr:MAG: histidine ammonia-lyase [Deltaproteobacteria bacterium CG07_land_8_20_14_0_80_38_7]
MILDGNSLTLEQIKLFLNENREIEISHSALKKIEKCRLYVEEKIKSENPLYGINTGFGMLASKRISDADLEKLQENLIVSHAAGIGEYIQDDLARLIMLLRANVLAKGYSGIKSGTLQTLVNIINSGIVPLIPIQGSVGASGDLCPLAHVALTLIGKGKVRYKSKIINAMEALSDAGISPVSLAPKEGIALINGTQAMAAFFANAVIKAERLIKLADISGALSLEGDMGSEKPFDEKIHKIRPHPGQLATASNIRKLIHNSEIVKSHKNCKRVQDPYCFRCIPQVHGAVKDAFKYAKSVIEREINSCTDNPLVFFEDDEILSGGNFHGEPLAIAMDLLAMAIAELASISERRVAILLSPLEGELPQKYLVENPGLNSGLAPMHVTMAAIVSENKTLCHPACVDTIPTFAGQEDHVSMGMWGATKLNRIIDNVEKVIAMELIAGSQAIDLGNRLNNKENKPGSGVAKAYSKVRELISYLDVDRQIYMDIEKAYDLVKHGDIIESVESAVGELLI